MKIYQNILSAIYKVLKVLLIIVFSAVTITVAIQIFSRYLFGKGWPWTDEVARYGNVLCVFLGASLVMYHNDHIFVNFLDGFISKRAARWVNFTRMLIVTVFSAIMTFISPKAIRMGAISVSANIGIPMKFVYAIFLVSFGLLFFYSLFNVLCYLLNYPLPYAKKTESEEMETLLQEANSVADQGEGDKS